MFFRFWRSIRLGFLILVFFALTLFLVATTPWRRWFGSPPTYAALLAEGRPLIAAIYRFRTENNLWPEYLDDLVPRYLPKPPAPIWYYVTTPDGPALSTPTGERRTHVGYDFDPIHPHWQVFGEVDNRVLPTSENDPPPPSPLSSQQSLANELRELDRRIAHEPMLLEHYRAKASVLRAAARDDEARATIHTAETSLPQNFWPSLAWAAMNPSRESVNVFAAWVAAHPSFTHQYYLAILEQQSHDAPAALAAIQKSLDYPIEVAPDDPNVLAFYFWDMTRYAFAQQNFPLALRLTDIWQNANTDHRADEKSNLPLRAAALLAIGDAKAAAALLAAFDAQKPPCWAKISPNSATRSPETTAPSTTTPAQHPRLTPSSLCPRNAPLQRDFRDATVRERLKAL